MGVKLKNINLSDWLIEAMKTDPTFRNMIMHGVTETDKDIYNLHQFDNIDKEE